MFHLSVLCCYCFGGSKGILLIKSSATAVLKSLLLGTGLTWSHSRKMDRLNNKKAVLSQGNCTMPQLFFLVQSSPTTFVTSLRAKLRKPGFTAPNIPAQNRI